MSGNLDERMESGLAGSVLRAGVDGAAGDPVPPIVKMDEVGLSRSRRAVRRLLDKELYQVLEFIDRNIATDISITHLSSKLGMSPSHFSHCFKQTLGVSPYAFVTRRKMLRATRLLIETCDPLDQIAAGVGFSDLGYFKRQFRKSLGWKPADLRPTGETGQADGQDRLSSIG